MLSVYCALKFNNNLPYFVAAIIAVSFVSSFNFLILQSINVNNDINTNNTCNNTNYNCGTDGTNDNTYGPNGIVYHRREVSAGEGDGGVPPQRGAGP